MAQHTITTLIARATPDQLIDDVLAPGVRPGCSRRAPAPESPQCSSSKEAPSFSRLSPIPEWPRSPKRKGIPVEIATFEQWEPAGRRFDRVVFAASFHWVDPAVALPKDAGILDDGGQLALIWNQLRPTRPTRAEFESIYRDYMNVERRSTDGNPDEIVDLLAAAGFTVTQRTLSA